MNVPRELHDLHAAVDDYLALRRAMGFKLTGAGRLLHGYVDHLHDHGDRTVTVDNALAWATSLPDAQPVWWAKRLGVVRGFAVYLHAFDPTVEIPPADLLPYGSRRAEPFIYTETDIAALLDAASGLRPLRAATYTTLIGLLAVTGMRVGEAIGLDRTDLDVRQGALTVHHGKFGKSRRLPLHPTTTHALATYLHARGQHLDRPVTTPALLVSTAGTRLIYNNVRLTFQQLCRTASIVPRSAVCRPRIHDLRHTFAVNTLTGWQRDGLDVEVRLPWLSTYLGHIAPSSTYWYLTATPELLAGAADRLELGGGTRP